MTALRMKQSSVNLINQIDDNNTALLEKVFLFLKVNVPENEKNKQVENGRAKAKELAHSFLGAFAESRTDEDWKKVKEDYLIEKYGNER